MSNSPAPAKSNLRSDAERNRRKILDAAKELFSSAGTGVSMAEIARRAGVGFATAQRRFPTKSTLIAEILQDQLQDLHRLAADAGEELDPWEAFVTLVRSCCNQQAQEPGLAQALTDVLSTASQAVITDSLSATFEAVTARARASGQVRDDISFADTLLLFKANAGVIANSPGDEQAASRRFVEIALRGLRADGPSGGS